jgi:hypothetical protein
MPSWILPRQDQGSPNPGRCLNQLQHSSALGIQETHSKMLTERYLLNSQPNCSSTKTIHQINLLLLAVDRLQYITHK